MRDGRDEGSGEGVEGDREGAVRNKRALDEKGELDGGTK